MSDEHPIQTLCAAFAVSRSGYYSWRTSKGSARAQRDQVLRAQIAIVHANSRCTYGSPRVTRELREQGEEVGRHRVARLMRAAGLYGRQNRRFRVFTTDSRHDEPISPNRMASIPPPTRSDRVWVSDITYVETDEGWLYVAGVLDRCSRRLVGWATGDSLEADLPITAMRMALEKRRPPPGLIHHSDRGVQYACDAYRDLLAAYNVIPSMSRRANCYDNAVMEAFWSTLKNELVHRYNFATRAEARAAIFDYVEVFYNRTRLHSALGYKSPLAYESNLN
jgi:putative transposase